MAKPSEHTLTPADMTPIRGEASTDLKNLEDIAPVLGRLVHGILNELRQAKTEDDIDIGPVRLAIEGSDAVAGIITMRTSEEGETVEISGKLGGELPTHRGVPFAAGWNGSFYRRAHPKQPNLVEDNERVETGQLIAWAFVDKNTQWGLKSPINGIVHFALENQDKVAAGETVMYYIEETK